MKKPMVSGRERNDIDAVEETQAPVPLPAASILLVRDGAAGLEVLMIRRAEHLRFAPGALVFPGGKVDVADARKSHWRSRITDTVWRADMHLRIAALRELWEETGIAYLESRQRGRAAARMQAAVQGRSHGSGWPPHAGMDRLHTRALIPFAHWVTPKGVPRRFDTHFYLAPATRYMQVRPSHLLGEAVSADWSSPAALLADWELDRARLMFPTRLTLMKLARAHDVNQALSMARQDPVVRTEPVINRGRDRVEVTIPEDAGYGVTAADPRDLAVERVHVPPRRA
ncbi:NUDIX hydrolase [Eilatimonas milleporae]|uniref:NUDIX domain-containing protein n=1 Tax=Eilatimonas milleporae TaxID=911205 RepID=A0A3M0CKB7_9PROT|nr:NUDIX domain-containing protein [Eilatimonas milleporae]RMB08820.1 NUDIX domain-containing protein [Eilatimonas milleporae]